MRRSQRDAEPALLAHSGHLAASAPHAQFATLRHPFNLRPMLITSCQRSLAFRKVRSAKNAASPDTIGSGKRRVSFRAAPAHSSGWGLPVFIQLSCLPSQARPVPYPVPHGPGAFFHSCYDGAQETSRFLQLAATVRTARAGYSGLLPRLYSRQGRPVAFSTALIRLTTFSILG